MSSAHRLRADSRASEPDAQPSEVREVVEALESFAFQSERVLARLDLRAASQARKLARQICTVAPFVRLGLDDELREAAAVELRDLMARARVCLGLEQSADSDDDQTSSVRPSRRAPPPEPDPEIEAVPIESGTRRRTPHESDLEARLDWKAILGR